MVTYMYGHLEGFGEILMVYGKQYRAMEPGPVKTGKAEPVENMMQSMNFP